MGYEGAGSWLSQRMLSGSVVGTGNSCQLEHHPLLQPQAASWICLQWYQLRTDAEQTGDSTACRDCKWATELFFPIRRTLSEPGPWRTETAHSQEEEQLRVVPRLCHCTCCCVQAASASLWVCVTRSPHGLALERAPGWDPPVATSKNCTGASGKGRTVGFLWGYFFPLIFYHLAMPLVAINSALEFKSY